MSISSSSPKKHSGSHWLLNRNHYEVEGIAGGKTGSRTRKRVPIIRNLHLADIQDTTQFLVSSLINPIILPYIFPYTNPLRPGVSAARSSKPGHVPLRQRRWRPSSQERIHRWCLKGIRFRVLGFRVKS